MAGEQLCLPFLECLNPLLIDLDGLGQIGLLLIEDVIHQLDCVEDLKEFVDLHILALGSLICQKSPHVEISVALGTSRQGLNRLLDGGLPP